MPRNRSNTVGTLASNWSGPLAVPGWERGNPLFCFASTYTFHASFFELDLLPRFLGLRFDETEGDRSFVVEREQALALARVCVLVDADHYDLSQSTLRWDQMSVHVPGGVQHAKVVLLIWENCARLIVSSANLTRPGYRRNREIAGVVDFCDHEKSAPRTLMLDAIEFIQQLSGWVRASEKAKVRLLEALADARARLRSWRRMPASFRPPERPRVTFVGGLPRKGGVTRSPLAQLVELWGSRSASEISVMTPFVGDLSTTIDPVVAKLLQLPRTRHARGCLVVPEHPSGDDQKRAVGLPRRFIESWSSAWRVDPGDVPTYIVPLRHDNEKANRDLHAKGILVTGEDVAMLLCGSSNFSPHGMGVGAANAEANFCYLDYSDKKRNGLRLKDRLPVDWEKDYCEHPFWPETAEPIDDEQPGANEPLPDAFLWAVYNQRTASLTVAVDPTAQFPAEWSISWPGEQSGEGLPLVDQRQQPTPPTDGRIVLQLPASLRGANIVGLRLKWRYVGGATKSAILPVHIESGEDLLPPEEFRSLAAEGIVECLLSGREPAEWVGGLELRQAAGQASAPPEELDSLHVVDTSKYVLYRTRRLGAALAILGERLLRTVRIRDALAYRLRQDPLGPKMLAEALVREWKDGSRDKEMLAASRDPLLFSLVEINLMVAHVAYRFTEVRLRPLFSDTIEEIDKMCVEVTSGYEPPSNLRLYLDAAKEKCQQLLMTPTVGMHHAG